MVWNNYNPGLDWYASCPASPFMREKKKEHQGARLGDKDSKADK